MSEAFTELTFHDSETPQRFATGVVAALRAGRVPGRLLYRTPIQAQRWLEYHQAWSPSRTDDALRALYREQFAVAARGLGEGPVHVVGLGCGGGHKDGALLDALAARAGRSGSVAPAGSLRYTPIDASPALVLEAVQHVRRRLPGLALHPLVADLEAEPALGPWLAGHEDGPTQRVHTCFGMIPNLDPERFPDWLARLLRPGDRLLFSANLSPGGMGADAARILPQYDNPYAEAWYTGALAALGFPPDALALAVAARPLALERLATGWDGSADAESPAEEAWQVVVTATPRRSISLRLLGEQFHFAEGAPLTVFTSSRFTLEAMTRLLEGAGLRTAEARTYAAGEEGVFLCGRQP